MDPRYPHQNFDPRHLLYSRHFFWRTPPKLPTPKFRPTPKFFEPTPPTYPCTLTIHASNAPTLYTLPTLFSRLSNNLCKYANRKLQNLTKTIPYTSYWKTKLLNAVFKSQFSFCSIAGAVVRNCRNGKNIFKKIYFLHANIFLRRPEDLQLY